MLFLKVHVGKDRPKQRMKTLAAVQQLLAVAFYLASRLATCICIPPVLG